MTAARAWVVSARRAFSSVRPPSFAPAALGLPRSGIREVMDLAWSMESTGSRVYHLEVGQPMFEPPPAALVNVSESVRELPNQRYIPNAGLNGLRSTVASYYNRRFPHLRHTSENVVISHGAVGSLATAFMATIEAGDEVLIPNPAWPNYEMAIRLYNGVPKSYDLDPNDGWKLDFDSLVKAITPKTKMVVVCTPSNPTGTCLSKEELERVVAIAKEHGIFVVSDEIYSQVYFGEEENDQRSEAFSILDCAHFCPDSTIVVSGVSKAYSMTGFRVGWLLGSPHLIDLSSKLSEAFLSCGVPFAQTAAKTAIETCMKEDDTFVQDCVAEYRDRRDAALSVMAGYDSLCQYTPQGAFYCLVSIRKWVDTNKDWLEDQYPGEPASKVFCQELLKAACVAVSPGATFGSNAANFIRVSLAQDHETVVQGIERLCKFIVDETPLKND